MNRSMPAADPFPHVVIDDLLSPRHYQRLCDYMQEQLAAGSFAPIPQRSGALYFSPPPPSESSHPLSYFFSRRLLRSMARLFGRPLSEDIYVGMHHHRPGSESGRIHADFNLVSMLKFQPLPNGINPYREAVIQDGRRMNFMYVDDTANRQPHTYKLMRSVALIYYFNSPGEWCEGDGGETGLYREKNAAAPSKRIAPRNNRLLAFAIGPVSFHRYMGSPKRERNTIIMWFHEEPNGALRRHDTRVWEYWNYERAFSPKQDRRWQPDNDQSLEPSRPATTA